MPRRIFPLPEQLDRADQRNLDAICGTDHLAHAALVSSYLANLARRADAGEIDPGTVDRYRTALAHYLAFVDTPCVRKKYAASAQVDRDFRLEFVKFLADRVVAANGRPRGPGAPMRGAAFVLDAARALYEWAADPDRGRLLPPGFRNPFRTPTGARSVLKGDPLAAPDITLEMAVAFFKACDRFQLRLFAPMMVFGLRASEPCFLFTEDLADGWLAVPNRPDLDVKTKGRRDKRFPLPDLLNPLWELLAKSSPGLLFQRRSVAEGLERAPSLGGQSAAELTAELRKRLAKHLKPGAAERRRIRDSVFKDAGGLTYDHIESEFKRIARSLCWSSTATVKDLRHLFATTMTNSDLPDAYLKYLMGHAPGKAAIVAYTHLHDLAGQYRQALDRGWKPVIDAVVQRARATCLANR